MKLFRIFSFIFLSVIGFSSSAKFVRGPNQDCYVQKSPMIDGALWVRVPHAFYEPMTLTYPTHYEFYHAGEDVKVTVDLNLQKQTALFQMKAPDAILSTTRELSKKDLNGSSLVIEGVYNAGVVTLGAPKKGTQDTDRYSVSCSFGLSEHVNDIKEKEEYIMNEMGPSELWEDANAPGLETLKKGSLIEVIREFTVPKGRPYVVEMNGLMEHNDFWRIEYPFRFAWAWIRNENNSYLYNREYRNGLKMRVLEVVKDVKRNEDPWAEYEVKVEMINPLRMEPIKSFVVTGRRSGRSEVKLQQFIEMMSPIMKVTPL